MDNGSKEINISTMPVPESVNVVTLQSYFKEKYELNDEEADTLVVSSSKSLLDFVAAAESMLEKSGHNISSEELAALLHRGKGLFLIMGQAEWALYTTAINVSHPDTIRGSIERVIKDVRQGFSEIIIAS